MNDPGDPGNPLQGLLGDLLKMIGSAPERRHRLAGGGPGPGPGRGHRGRARGEPRPDRAHPPRGAGPGGRAARGRGHRPAGRPRRPPAGRAPRRAVGAWALLRPRVVDPAAGEDGGGAGPGHPAGCRPSPTASTAEDGGLGELLGTFRHHHGAGPARHAVRLGRRPPRPAGPRPLRPAHALARSTATCWWSRPTSPPSPRTGACPLDQAQLWVCIRELTAEAVLGLPHVAARASPDCSTRRPPTPSRPSWAWPSGWAARPATRRPCQSLLSDPEALLADLLTPGQRRGPPHSWSP